MKTIAPILVLATLAGTPALARAQAADGLSPGEHVRVTWSDASMTYPFDRLLRQERLELVSVGDGHLMGRRGAGVLVVRATSIKRLERQIGTKPASAPAMAIGSAAGFAGGFVLGALFASVDPTVKGSSEAMNLGLSSGVLIGAPLGAIVAWLASRARPIYEEVLIADVTPFVAVEPFGGVEVSLKVGAP